MFDSKPHGTGVAIRGLTRVASGNFLSINLRRAAIRLENQVMTFFCERALKVKTKKKVFNLNRGSCCLKLKLLYFDLQLKNFIG